MPTDLQPAYERPLDPASVDERMRAQLEFESSGVSPRNLDLGADSVTPSDRKPNKKRGIGRNLAVGTVALTGAVGALIAIERAYDQQQTFYKPVNPELTKGMHNR